MRSTKQVLVALLVMFMATVASAQSKPSASHPPKTRPTFTKVRQDKGIVEYVLNNNGLRVLLIENHGAPVANVTIVYHVGSRNEAVGFTGSTHILEHMMFKGTPKYPNIQAVLKPIGAENNASTWLDRTSYYEVVPADKLETALDLEADRMRNLRLRKQDLDSEMTVVRNEMERGENNPSSVLFERLTSTAFIESPYHHPTIGWKSDVEGVPLSRLKQFYDTYYYPNNATVIVAGDFQQQDALNLVSKYFSVIKRSPQPIPTVYTVEPPQEGERRFELRRAGDSQRVFIGFHVPRAFSRDTFALDATSAILGDSSKPSSRLYKRLIETNMASEVFASEDEKHDPTLFVIGASVNPGVKVEDVEAALEDELAKLATTPVTAAELQRAKTEAKKQRVLSGIDPAGFADQLAEAESQADWTFWLNYDDNFQAVSAGDISQAAGRYFVKNNRTVGIFTPIDENNPSVSAPDTYQAAPPTLTTPNTVSSTKTGKQGASKAASKASFASQVTKVVLPNGLTVLIMPNHSNGAVSVRGLLPAGTYYSPQNKVQVAGFTAAMLTSGSAKYSKTQIAEMLQEMGANIHFTNDTFTVDFGSDVVAEDLPRYMALLSELLQHPAFPTSELDLTKQATQANLRQLMADTEANASAKLSQSAYAPGSPYYQTPFDQLYSTTPSITVQDLQNFHQQHYSPNGMILTIVGDVKADEALALVKSNFGSWTGPAPQAVSVQQPKANLVGQRIEVVLKDKANVSILIGHPVALQRNAKDYFAARIANAALGGDTLSSRLGTVVRVKNGLTYGIYSQFSDPTYGGALWEVALSVNPVNAEKAVKLVNEVLNDYVKTGITDKELADEASKAAGSFQVRLRSSSGIASMLLQFEYLGLGAAGMDSYGQQMKSVTKADVNAAIKNYFHPSQAITVLAGTIKH